MDQVAWPGSVACMNYPFTYVANPLVRLRLPFAPLAQAPARTVDGYTIFYRCTTEWLTYGWEGLRMQDIEHYPAYDTVISDTVHECIEEHESGMPGRYWITGMEWRGVERSDVWVRRGP